MTEVPRALIAISDIVNIAPATANRPGIVDAGHDPARSEAKGRRRHDGVVDSSATGQRDEQTGRRPAKRDRRAPSTGARASASAHTAPAVHSGR